MQNRQHESVRCHKRSPVAERADHHGLRRPGRRCVYNEPHAEVNVMLAIIGSTISLVAFGQPAIHQAGEEPAKVMTLTRENASAFAKLALKGIRKEYPNK